MSKLTVQLSDEMDEVVGDLAEQRGVPKTQVLRNAVLLMKYLDDAVAGGSKIELVNDNKGTRDRLVMESQIVGVPARSQRRGR
jgi:hypothetical protein